MDDERKYTEEEITAIFRQATQAQESARRDLAQSQGLTLAELQQIGKEAGITPAFIARAAASVVGRSDPPLPPKTYLGLPVSVERIVDLPGPLTDEGWDELVVDLRETFRASGEIRRDGSLREWRNGNLYALVEPTASGHRLNLGTSNGSLRIGLTGGMMSLAVGMILVLMLVVSGQWMVALDKTFMVSMFAVLGLGSMGVSAYRLPRWAVERKRQMDAVATRAIDRIGVQEPVNEPAPAGRPDIDLLEDSANAAQAPSGRRTRT